MSEISAVSAALAQEMAGTAVAVQALKLAQQQERQVGDLVAQMVENMSKIQEAGKGQHIDLAG